MKKLPISKFDLAMIIAFVVIGALGGGAWYYLNGQLTDAVGQVGQEKSQYDRYASIKAGGQDILVKGSNQKILENNIDILKGQLVPLIQTKLIPKDDKLASIEKKDPVAWKHDLDSEVHRLTTEASGHGVKLPPNFYFAFSNYTNSNPADEQTAVLSKQLFAIEQITNILVDAPVHSINDIRRTYEEDAGRGGGGGGAPPPGPGGPGAGSPLPGTSYMADGGAYRGYPYEIDFETNTAGFHKVMNDFLKSPYIFVVRTIAVQSSQTTSPMPADLDRMAGGPNDINVTGQDPGVVANTVSTKGPQYLFGNQTLHVKMRVDLIEWLAPPPN
jgi:hypothetical protein